METYTPSQFLRSAELRGITCEAFAKDYTDQHPKELYTEDDLADLYRETHREGPHQIIHGLSADGQNMFGASSVRERGKRLYI